MYIASNVLQYLLNICFWYAIEVKRERVAKHEPRFQGLHCPGFIASTKRRQEGTDPENEAGETSINLTEEAEERQLHRKA